MHLNLISKDSLHIFLNYHISTNFLSLQFLLLIRSHFNHFFNNFLFIHLRNCIPFHYCLKKLNFLNCLHLNLIFQLSFYQMPLPNLSIMLLINLNQTILNYNLSIFILHFDYLYFNKFIKINILSTYEKFWFPKFPCKIYESLSPVGDGPIILPG